MKSYFQTIADTMGLTLVYTRAQAANVILDGIMSADYPVVIVNPLLNGTTDTSGRFIKGFEVSILTPCPLDFDESATDAKQEQCLKDLNKFIELCKKNTIDSFHYNGRDNQITLFYDKFDSTLMGALTNVRFLINPNTCEDDGENDNIEQQE